MNAAIYNICSMPQQQQPIIPPFGPVVGRNSRERRRIRRAQERMQKAFEAADTTVLTPSSIYPSAASSPALPAQPTIKGHHHHQSVDWSKPAHRPSYHVRSRSTPNAVRGDIRTLWTAVGDASQTQGFPTAFSIPRRSNAVGTSQHRSRPSSMALLDCFDPEVDCLSDLDSLMSKATVEDDTPELCHSPASSASGSSSSILSSPSEFHLPLPVAMYPTSNSKNAETAYFRTF